MIVSHKWGEKWILIHYLEGTSAASAGRTPTISFQAWDGDHWSSPTKAQTFDTREEAEEYVASHKDRMQTVD